MSVRPDHLFPGKDYDEVFILFFRQHWVRLVPRVLRIGFEVALVAAAAWVTFVGFDLADASTDRLIGAVLTFAFLVTQFELLVVFYHYFLRVTIFSDKKVHRIRKTLLLIDDHRSIDIAMLQDIRKVQHGLLQTLLGYGSLILEAQESQLRLHFVPHVQRKVEILLELRERARTGAPWGRAAAA